MRTRYFAKDLRRGRLPRKKKKKLKKQYEKLFNTKVQLHVDTYILDLWDYVRFN